MARVDTHLFLLSAFFILLQTNLFQLSTTYKFDAPVPGTPLNDQEYEKFFSLLMPESTAKSLCALRLAHGCEEHTIRRYDAYENHGVVPTGPICTDLKTSSSFDNFCDFARFRCFHMLHYVKRIPCEEQELKTTQAPTAAPAKAITTETKPAGGTAKESVTAQSQQQTTPQKKMGRTNLGADMPKLQAYEMTSSKNDPVTVQDEDEMLAKPQDETSTVSHNPATSTPESTRIQGTEYPKEYPTANNEQDMSEQPEPQDYQFTKSKSPDFKAMEKTQDIDETLDESDRDDDIIGFARPQNPPSSADETTVTQKPLKATRYEQATPTKETVSTKLNSYQRNKQNILQLAWAKMIKNPANIKETTKKTQDIAEDSEDSDRDNDLVGFARPQNPVEETTKGIYTTTKAPRHQRAMAKKENIKTQQDSYGQKKTNMFEMAWATMIKNPANIKETTREPQDIEETTEDSGRDNDLIGFARPQNLLKSAEETVQPTKPQVTQNVDVPQKDSEEAIVDDDFRGFITLPN